MPGDRSIDLLKIVRGGQDGTGIRIAKVETSEPNAITLSFEGTALALDLEIFEIPVSLYPLKPGDRFFTFPIIGNGTNRWGLLEKINGGNVVLATMQDGSSLKIDGIEKIYTSDDLIIPPYVSVSDASSKHIDSDYYLQSGDIRPLQAGDRVSISATLDNGKIKYIILNLY